MAKQHANFIAGEWVEGAEATRNVNPSDTNDIVGEYARASAASPTPSASPTTRRRGA